MLAKLIIARLAMRGNNSLGDNRILGRMDPLSSDIHFQLVPDPLIYLYGICSSVATTPLDRISVGLPRRLVLSASASFHPPIIAGSINSTTPNTRQSIHISRFLLYIVHKK